MLYRRWNTSLGTYAVACGLACAKWHGLSTAAARCEPVALHRIRLRRRRLPTSCTSDRHVDSSPRDNSWMKCCTGGGIEAWASTSPATLTPSMYSELLR